MPHNPHLEILCAEAERFPHTPPETAAESEGLRAAAAELAKTLRPAPEVHSSGFFARRWQSLSATLEPLLAEVQRPREAAVSDEFRWG